MSPRVIVPDRDRLIARIPAGHGDDDRRRRILDQVVGDTQHGSTVYVETSRSRSLDDVVGVVGRILGLAYVPGGTTALALVVDPIDPAKRMLAIPVSQLVRIRWAYSPAGSVNPADYDLGLVIAGPPL